MKKTTLIVGLVIFPTIIYILACLISLEPNIAKWEMPARALFIITIALAETWVVYRYNEIKDGEMAIEKMKLRREVSEKEMALLKEKVRRGE